MTRSFGRFSGRRKIIRPRGLVPERLLLFAQIAEPNDEMAIKMEMDGSPLTLTRIFLGTRASCIVSWVVCGPFRNRSREDALDLTDVAEH